MLLKNTLAQLGIEPERLKIEGISASERSKLPSAVHAFTEYCIVNPEAGALAFVEDLGVENCFHTLIDWFDAYTTSDIDEPTVTLWHYGVDALLMGLAMLLQVSLYTTRYFQVNDTPLWKRHYQESSSVWDISEVWVVEGVDSITIGSFCHPGELTGWHFTSLSSSATILTSEVLVQTPVSDDEDISDDEDTVKTKEIKKVVASLKEKSALSSRTCNYRTRQKEASQKLPDEARAVAQTKRKV